MVAGFIDDPIINFAKLAVVLGALGLVWYWTFMIITSPTKASPSGSARDLKGHHTLGLAYHTPSLARDLRRLIILLVWPVTLRGHHTPGLARDLTSHHIPGLARDLRGLTVVPNNIWEGTGPRGRGGTPILRHGREVPWWWPPFLGFPIWLGPYFIPQHNPIDPFFV